MQINRALLAPAFCLSLWLCLWLAAPCLSQTSTSPSVIGGILREQLTRHEPASSSPQAPQQETTTRVPTTQTTQAPPVSPAASTSQQPASQQPSQATTTSQQQATQSVKFQVLRPKSAAAASQQPEARPPIPTTTTITSITSPTSAGSDSPSSTQQVPSESLVCQHNNQTYALGAKWNDDCLQVCECVQGPLAGVAVSACRPRCPIYKDPPGEECKLERSRSDECCLEWTCQLEAKFAPGVASTSARQPLVTTTQTDRGQLNMSTTEIRMPTPAPTTPDSLVVVSSSPVATTVRPPPPPTTITTLFRTSASPSPSSPTLITTTQLGNRRTAAATTTTTTTTSSSNSSRPATVIPSSQRQQPTTTSVPVAFTTTSASSTSQRRPSIQQSEPTTTRNPTASGRRGHAAFSSAPLTDFSAMTRSRYETTSTTPTLPPISSTTPSEEPTSSSSSSAGETDLLDPDEHHLCIIPRLMEAFRLNSSWQDECNRSCRCVFRTEPRDPLRDMTVRPTSNLKNESMLTEIRCGWPELCLSQLADQLAPTLACPEPRLSLNPSLAAYEACECPTISCALQPRRQQQQQQQTSSTQTPAGCKSRQTGGKRLLVGESFNDECHSICRCQEDGEIRCAPLTCPSEPPASDALCSSWQLDPNFRANSSLDRCCAEFVCKSESPAELSKPSDSSASESNPKTVPPSVPTQTAAAAAGPTTMTTTQQTAAMEAKQPRACLLLGKELPHGQRVPEEMQPRPSGGALEGLAASMVEPCEKVCSCNDGKIVCKPVCAPLSETPPEDLECPPTLAYQLLDDCCPRWACQLRPDPVPINYALQDFQVAQVNATTLEVLITLPAFALGQRGRLELNYTSVPISELSPSASEEEEHQMVEPPAQARWQRKRTIKTFDGILSSEQIKYYWTDLKPGHRYWFKLLVRFEGAGESANQIPPAPFDRPIESSLQSVVIPSLAPPTTTTSTTLSSSASSGEPLELETSTRLTTHAVASSTTTTSTTTPAPTRILQPASSNSLHNSAHHRHHATATTTTTTTSTTTTTLAPRISEQQINVNGEQRDIIKYPDLVSGDESSTTPCSQQQNKSTGQQRQGPTVGQEPVNNQLDEQTARAANSIEVSAPHSLAALGSWSEQLQQQVHNSIQRNAWHLLVAFFIMTVLFVVVLYSYCKKVRVVASITTPAHHHHHNGHHHHHHQSAYDNPTFTKLVSYYANQPHVLLVDESNQNFDNLAKQKNLEVDKSSPLHANNNNNSQVPNNNHRTTPVHHQNGRQHLI